MLNYLKRNLTLILTVLVVIVLNVTIFMNAVKLQFYSRVQTFAIARCRNESRKGNLTGGSWDLYNSSEDFEHFDNEVGSPGGKYVVPNIVHFIRWNRPFSFIEAVCLLAAVKNQNPDKIYIHGDGKVMGKYWDMAMSFPRMKEVVELKDFGVPTEIFGQKLSHIYHASDVARIILLMCYGGIFLDNDSFLVRNLDEFRKFEMTLGWEEGKERMANQGIIAHKNARFLRKWLESYRGDYDGDSWFYNTMSKPVQTILKNEPHLIHRMEHLWGEDPLGRFLYLEDHSSWRKHYVIHLSVRYWAQEGQVKGSLSSLATYPVDFDENNIKKYNCTVRDMVQSVYPLVS